MIVNKTDKLAHIPFPSQKLAPFKENYWKTGLKLAEADTVSKIGLDYSWSVISYC